MGKKWENIFQTLRVSTMRSPAPKPTNLPLGHSVCCVEVYVQVHICRCIFTKNLNLNKKQNLRRNFECTLNFFWQKTFENF